MVCEVAPQVGKLQQVSVACKSQVLGRQVLASSVSKFSKSQVSASLGKSRQVSARFRSPSFSKFRRVVSASSARLKFRQVSASLGKISMAKLQQVSACSVSKFGKSQRSESVHKMFVSRGAWRSDSILSQGSQGLVFESGKVRGSRLSPRGGHGLDFLSQGSQGRARRSGTAHTWS